MNLRNVLHGPIPYNRIRTRLSQQVGSPAVLAAGTGAFAAVALMGGTVVVWSPAGRRLLPPMVLDSPCVFLAAHAPYRLLAVTCTGTLLLWDLHACKCLLQESVLPVLSAAAASDATGTRLNPKP